MADIRQEFTNQIIDALKKGTVPWRKPWVNDPNFGMPMNVISKKRYQGINTLLLNMEQDYESKYWATFKQWQSLGGSVKRGEMGTRIVFYKPIKCQQENAEGKTEEVTSRQCINQIGFNL